MQKLAIFEGFLAFEDVAPTMNPVLAKAIARIIDATKGVQALLDNPPWGTPDSVKGAWLTTVKQMNDRIVPFLMSTTPKADKDPAYARKWKETAQAAISQLDTALKSTSQVGYLNNAKAAVEVATRTVVQSAIDTAETAAGVGFRAILMPLLKSPLFWVVGLGAGAYFFGPTLYAARKARRLRG